MGHRGLRAMRPAQRLESMRRSPPRSTPPRTAADCGDPGQSGRAAGQAPRRPRPTRHPHPIHLPRHVRRPRHESEGVAEADARLAARRGSRAGHAAMGRTLWISRGCLSTAIICDVDCDWTTSPRRESHRQAEAARTVVSPATCYSSYGNLGRSAIVQTVSSRIHQPASLPPIPRTKSSPRFLRAYWHRPAGSGRSCDGNRRA